MKLDIDFVNGNNGVDIVLEWRDKLYLKDKLQLRYQNYDKFAKIKRPSEMPIANFVVDFELHFNKVMVYKMELLDILAYKFLNNANISDFHEKSDLCSNNRVVIQCHKRTIAQSFLGSDLTCVFKCLSGVIFTGFH